jgi:hypothetical protein
VKSSAVFGVKRPRPLKLTLTFGAVAAIAVAAVVIAVMLHGRHGFAWPKPVQISSATASNNATFPAPPQGAIVFSRQLGSDVLALGVVPRKGLLLLQASVIDGQGKGVSGLDVRLATQGSTADVETCGAGCYRAAVPARGAPSSAVVEIRGGPNATRWHVALPPVLPPQDATALVLHAGRVWRALHSLSFREQLASSPRSGVTSTWRIEAPDRVAYTVGGEGAGVVIGTRRWDRMPGKTTWVESPQTQLTQPLPAWVLVSDAHVLGTTTVNGRPAWRISFFDPATPAWFDVAVDKRTLHTLETQMVTTAHFMHDVYGAFDSTPPIVPPR